jgi:DNA-binding LytR/AlgR family response regulator
VKYLRIAICDDTEEELILLSQMIKSWAKTRSLVINIDCYNSSESFKFAWSDHSFDLVFLDVQMENMSGIDLAQYIRKTDDNVLIVFETNYAQYSLQGYDVEAMHFLIKPLSSKKLIPVLEKAYRIWYAQHDKSLIVTNDGGQRKLPVNQIIYISMLSHTAEIHTMDETYEIRKTAAELAAHLPDYFMHCHRSYLVNLLKTDCVYKDSLRLSNGKNLPISRNRSKLIKDAYMRLLAE